MAKYTYIKQDIPGYYIEFEEKFNPDLYNNIGTTYEDFIDNAFGWPEGRESPQNQLSLTFSSSSGSALHWKKPSSRPCRNPWPSRRSHRDSAAVAVFILPPIQKRGRRFMKTFRFGSPCHYNIISGTFPAAYRHPCRVRHRRRPAGRVPARSARAAPAAGGCIPRGASSRRRRLPACRSLSAS